MSNVLNEEKKQQVIALGRMGWLLRRIQRTTGVRRETAAGYLKGAGLGFRAPGGWGRQPPAAKPGEEVIPDPGAAKPGDEVIPDPGAAKPAKEVIPDFGGGLEAGASRAPEPEGGGSRSASACVPYQAVIEVGLWRGRNAMAIWQELVDRCGFAAGYQSVRRFVWKLQVSQSLEACGVIETAPGEEAQVDYGSGPMVRDPQSGKYRRTRLFVMTLGYSRKSVRLLKHYGVVPVPCLPVAAPARSSARRVRAAPDRGPESRSGTAIPVAAEAAAESATSRPFLVYAIDLGAMSRHCHGRANFRSGPCRRRPGRAQGGRPAFWLRLCRRNPLPEGPLLLGRRRGFSQGDVYGFPHGDRLLDGERGGLDCHLSQVPGITGLNAVATQAGGASKRFSQ